MQDTNHWVENLLIQNGEANCVSKVIKAEINSATSKGDNYGGDINRAVMDVILKSGKRCKKSVIIKEVPTTPYRRDFCNLLGVFRREIIIYRDVLPSMEDVMQEFGDHTEFMWGTCLDYKPYDRLILSDLAETGYIMQDRSQGLDLEHCLIVARSIAKFHATSVILQQRGLLCMELFKEHAFTNSISREMNQTLQTNALQRFAETVDSWGTEWKNVAEKIRTKLVPHSFEIIMNLLKSDKEMFKVLNHGDCWVNNMLFKYGLDDVTPISVKFIDFQMSFYNSPAFDLKYFLTLSPNLEVRKNSITKILEVYHDTLMKQLKLYNLTEITFTLEQLKDEIRRVDIFGLFLGVTALPLMLAKKVTEIPDVEEIMRDITEMNEDALGKWLEYCKPSKEYTEIMKIILSEIVQNNSM